MIKHQGTIEKICLTCGNTFFVFPYNENITKFCSHKCYSNYPKQKERAEIKCLDCGKIFFVIPTRKNTAKYCSKHCADKYTLRAVREKKGIERQCVACGITFYVIPARKDNAKYCSKLCANKHAFAGNDKKEKTGIEKVCAYCGKKYYVFKCNINKSKYCSKECRCAAMRGRISHNKRAKISCICKTCGVEFFVPECRKNAARFCSKKCWYVYANKDIKKKGIVKNCLVCDKEFYVSQVRKNAKFCSKKCYYKYPKNAESLMQMGASKTKYKFNKYELEYWYIGLGWTCQEIADYCSVNLEVVWRNLKKHSISLRTIGDGNRGKPHTREWNNKIALANKGKVISDNVRKAIAVKVKKLWESPDYVNIQMRGRAIRPNRLEDKFINMLRDNNITSFKYSGDFSYMIGTKNPDFVNIDNKQVIDLFGNFYHEEYEVPERISYFKQYGFSTLILWESEFNNLNNVINKVNKFIEVSNGIRTK